MYDAALSKSNVWIRVVLMGRREVPGSHEACGRRAMRLQDEQLQTANGVQRRWAGEIETVF